MFKHFFYFYTLFFALICHAEEHTHQDAVLDFEADVIQGERKKPDVFLQLGKQNQTLESILFTRKDFKDFHKLEKKWRPSYMELKK